MVGQATLIGDLQSLVGPENARPPNGPIPRPFPSDFMVDGILPQVIVFPSTYEEVAAVMRYANATGMGVIPLGSGQYKGTGNLPRRYDIALSVARLNRIIEYEPADLTVTCQGGITLGSLSERLRESGQMTPFGSTTPGLESSPSIGKLLATNGFGNLQHGTPRDFTIGMRVVTADGRITRAGGKVVKNVAGYDLCKLYIGSSGSLGVIVEVSMKIVPLPQASEEVRLESESLGDACRFATELKRRGVSLWEATVRRPMFRVDKNVSSATVHVLTVHLAGTLAGVQRSLAEIERLSQLGGTRPASRNHERAHEIDDWTSPRPSQEELLQCQMSVLPSRVPALVEALDETAPGASVSVRPIRGMVTATLRTSSDERVVHSLRTASAKLGATLTVTSCSPELKRRIDVFGESPPAFELMRRVKQEFDPKGILSPGRFLGRL